MNNQFNTLIDSYLNNKVGIDAGFLNEALSNGLQENIMQLQRDDMMVDAGIGNDNIKDPQQKMRGDQITGWIKAMIIFLSRSFYNWRKDLLII